MTALGNLKSGQAKMTIQIFNLAEEIRTEYFTQKTLAQQERESWDEFFNESGFEETDVRHNFVRLDMANDKDYIELCVDDMEGERQFFLNLTGGEMELNN